MESFSLSSGTSGTSDLEIIPSLCKILNLSGIKRGKKAECQFPVTVKGRPVGPNVYPADRKCWFEIDVSLHSLQNVSIKKKWKRTIGIG